MLQVAHPSRVASLRRVFLTTTIMLISYALTSITLAQTLEVKDESSFGVDQQRLLLEALASDSPIEARVEMLHDLAVADLTALAPVVQEVAQLPFELPLRAAGIDLLSRLPVERAQPVLEKLARHDPDPHVQALSAEALRVLVPANPATHERLATALAAATQAADRRALVSQLGTLEDGRAQELLWRIAADPMEAGMVAATAVEGLLVPADRPDLSSKLESLLAERLAKYSRQPGSTAAVNALRARLADPDIAIRGEQSH